MLNMLIEYESEKNVKSLLKKYGKDIDGFCIVLINKGNCVCIVGDICYDFTQDLISFKSDGNGYHMFFCVNSFVR